MAFAEWLLAFIDALLMNLYYINYSTNVLTVNFCLSLDDPGLFHSDNIDLERITQFQNRFTLGTMDFNLHPLPPLTEKQPITHRTPHISIVTHLLPFTFACLTTVSVFSVDLLNAPELASP